MGRLSLFFVVIFTPRVIAFALRHRQHTASSILAPLTTYTLPRLRLNRQKSYQDSFQGRTSGDRHVVLSIESIQFRKFPETTFIQQPPRYYISRNQSITITDIRDLISDIDHGTLLKPRLLSRIVQDALGEGNDTLNRKVPNEGEFKKEASFEPEFQSPNLDRDTFEREAMERAELEREAQETKVLERQAAERKAAEIAIARNRMRTKAREVNSKMHRKILLGMNRFGTRLVAATLRGGSHGTVLRYG